TPSTLSLHDALPISRAPRSARTTGSSPTGSRARTTPPPSTRSGSALAPTARRLWRDRWIYLFLAPTLVLHALFTLWPVVASYWYSLLDWNGFDRGGTYVGLANYAEVLGDPLFWNAFK